MFVINGDEAVNLSMVRSIRKRDNGVKQKYQIVFEFNTTTDDNIYFSYNNVEERNEHFENIMEMI